MKLSSSQKTRVKKLVAKVARDLGLNHSFSRSPAGWEPVNFTLGGTKFSVWRENSDCLTTYYKENKRKFSDDWTLSCDDCEVCSEVLEVCIARAALWVIREQLALTLDIDEGLILEIR